MKKRKFANGGVPEGGRFDEDTYTRARRFVESGEKKEDSKPAAKKASSAASSRPDRMPGKTAEDRKDSADSAPKKTAEDRMDSADSAPKKNAAGIPIDPNPPKAPASTGEDTSGSSNFGRAVSALPPATALRAAQTAMAAKRAADTDRAAKSMAATRAATNTPGAARLAESAKRSKDASDARLPGEVMDILNRPMKKGGSVAKYAKGGSIDGIAQRGKTRGKVC